jgi:uncharacterized protein
MNRRRLIIFARAPVPGETKTRLCPPLCLEAAARLAEAFLLDEVETFSMLPDLRVSVAYTPDGSGSQFRRILGDAMIPWLAPQGGGRLGDRLQSAFAAACPSWWPVAIIGSDSPDLPPSVVETAFRTLENDEADVVIGPAVDGGYYLIAARQVHPVLFEEIPWSTADVLAVTLEHADQAGLRVRLLPLWEDVDVPDDLRRLRARLEGAPPLVAPRTRAVLRSLGEF